MMLLTPLFLGFTLTFALLWVLVRSPIARFFADAPDHRKVHQQIVPRIGGLGLVVAALGLLGAGWLLFPALVNLKLSVSLAFACLFLLGAGTLDDVHPIGFKVKFLLQFALSGALVLVFGNHLSTVAIFGHVFSLGGAGPLISIFWFVALMNAFNIIDGIDGLAGGVALCGLASIGLLAFSGGDTGLLVYTLAICGIIGGFLPFNFHARTKVFLGDTGSQFLGACLALFTLKAQELPNVGHSVLIPLLLVGYPLWDVGVAMVRRFAACGRRRLSLRVTRMFLADNEHMHHRLVYLGMSHVQSAGLLILVAGSQAAAAFILARTDGFWTSVVLGYVAASMLLILDRLGYFGRSRRFAPRRIKALPERIVGVITGSELFLHSLKNFEQRRFDFLHLPTNLTKFIGPDLSAVLLYNAVPGRFEEQWTALLRMQEFGEIPAIVVAGAEEITRVRAQNPTGFRQITFLEKPGRIPEIIRVLESVSSRSSKSQRLLERDGRFSLAEIAIRNHVR